MHGPMVTRLLGFSLGLLLLAACGGGAEAGGAAQAADSASTDSSAVPEVWVELARRDKESSSVRPERFQARSAELRVITRMGELISPLTPGLVVTNILSDRTSLPLASVRAEQNRPDSVTVDTTDVEVESGELYLFVAEHRGLKEWTVVVQEKKQP